VMGVPIGTVRVAALPRTPAAAGEAGHRRRGSRLSGSRCAMMSAPARSKLRSLGLSATCAEVLTPPLGLPRRADHSDECRATQGAHRHLCAVPTVRGISGVLPARDVQPQAGAQRPALPA
jgi:hypothetical protein